MILDADIKEKAQRYRIKNNIAINVPLNFLPIESLEKFLRNKLYLNVDHGLFRRLNDYVFQQRSLSDIIDMYKKENDIKEDTNGKKLYSLIDSELRERKKDRHDLVELVVDYLFEKDSDSIKPIIDFLKKQFSE